MWFAGECLRWLRVTDRPEQEEKNTLTQEEQAAVRRVLVARIKVQASADAPLFNPDVPESVTLLHEWWREEGREPVQAHLLNVFAKEPFQVTRFLQMQAPIVWSSARVGPYVGNLRADALVNIEPFIDLDMLAACVRPHCSDDNPTNFPDEDMEPLGQRLAEQFMYLYHRRKNEGKDQNKTAKNVEEAEQNSG